MESSENNVWSTLSNLGGQLLTGYQNVVKINSDRAVSIASANANAWTAINAARSTPSGNGQTYNGVNPPPGSFGVYPQAEVKPQQGPAPTVDITSAITRTFSQYGLAAVLLVGIVIAALVFSRR
jgi:hypothetical protein